MRGTPQQIIEKYQSLARDKATSGDRVLAEAFLQHAEHYLRILVASQPARNEERQNEDRSADDRQGDERGADNRSSEERSEEFAAAGEAGSDGMAVIGDDDPANSSIVETPEAGNGGRRRGRRPVRRSQRGDNADSGSAQRDAGEQSAPEVSTAPADGGGEQEIVVDASIRAAE